MWSNYEVIMKSLSGLTGALISEDWISEAGLTSLEDIDLTKPNDRQLYRWLITYYDVMEENLRTVGLYANDQQILAPPDYNEYVTVSLWRPEGLVADEEYVNKHNKNIGYIEARIGSFYDAFFDAQLLNEGE
ncbi:hypothetical protein IV55_GL000727 [Furfurilactobacillus siliginis]|uniref:Uncharacterized protein n=1 Tax=Furfurilactobacillus siliginis TaxID=348151 RepID=A0A0R2L5A7_9LACO|nr:hypothetical protein IV55_GL000727 [Furfurilactobacillus siliginis]